VFGIWELGFCWDLVVGIWDFPSYTPRDDVDLRKWGGAPRFHRHLRPHLDPPNPFLQPRPAHGGASGRRAHDPARSGLVRRDGPFGEGDQLGDDLASPGDDGRRGVPQARALLR